MFIILRHLGADKVASSKLMLWKILIIIRLVNQIGYAKAYYTYKVKHIYNIKQDGNGGEGWKVKKAWWHSPNLNFTRHGTALKHKSINRNLKLAFASIYFENVLTDFEAPSEFSRAFQRQRPLVQTEWSENILFLFCFWSDLNGYHVLWNSCDLQIVW